MGLKIEPFMQATSILDLSDIYGLVQRFHRQCQVHRNVNNACILVVGFVNMPCVHVTTRLSDKDDSDRGVVGVSSKEQVTAQIAHWLFAPLRLFALPSYEATLDSVFIRVPQLRGPVTLASIDGVPALFLRLSPSRASGLGHIELECTPIEIRSKRSQIFQVESYYSIECTSVALQSRSKLQPSPVQQYVFIIWSPNIYKPRQWSLFDDHSGAITYYN
ncbi:hypothetical protein EDB83DRAFT_2316905 [Lactarius deliciosus]|nr:hypothetical protein EDB83DRAFT_2316905 [Lactarius deliciosus]